MKGKQGDEAAAVTQVRDYGGLDQRLLVEELRDWILDLSSKPTVFTNRLDTYCEKKRKVNADCQAFNLSTLKNVTTIY